MAINSLMSLSLHPEPTIVCWKQTMLSVAPKNRPNNGAAIGLVATLYICWALLSFGWLVGGLPLSRSKAWMLPSLLFLRSWWGLAPVSLSFVISILWRLGCSRSLFGIVLSEHCICKTLGGRTCLRCLIYIPHVNATHSAFMSIQRTHKKQKRLGHNL